jgi:hypothetical protein
MDHEYGVVPPVAATVAEYGTVAIPSGSEDVPITRGAGVTVKVRFAVAVCAGEPESVAWNTRGVALTAGVGVPLIRPDDALRVRPAGKVPEVNCQVTAPVPPVYARVWEYGVTTAPFGSDDVVMINWGTTVSVRFAVAV